VSIGDPPLLDDPLALLVPSDDGDEDRLVQLLELVRLVVCSRGGRFGQVEVSLGVGDSFRLVSETAERRSGRLFSFFGDSQGVSEWQGQGRSAFRASEDNVYALVPSLPRQTRCVRKKTRRLPRTPQRLLVDAPHIRSPSSPPNNFSCSPTHLSPLPRPLPTLTIRLPTEVDRVYFEEKLDKLGTEVKAAVQLVVGRRRLEELE
jgi:hypothetical protein